MATKKKIIGQSNLSAPPKPTEGEKERLNLVAPTAKKSRLKNFLLNDLDRERLIKLVVDANRASPHKKISEASVIKALLLLGSKMDIEKIIKAAREA